MTDTVTIRPTRASDVKLGDRIRVGGSTETVTRIEDSPTGTIRIRTDSAPYVPLYHSNIVDVVVDTHGPEEPTWPTSPLIRVTRSTYTDTPCSDLALRDPDGDYIINDGDPGPRDAETITEWEDLAAVRADLIDALREARDDAADDGSPGAWLLLATSVDDLLDDAGRTQT
nr:hypothetical protein [Actinomyces sp.]